MCSPRGLLASRALPGGIGDIELQLAAANGRALVDGAKLCPMSTGDDNTSGILTPMPELAAYLMVATRRQETPLRTHP